MVSDIFFYMISSAVLLYKPHNFQPFTEPLIRPAIKYFCKNMKINVIGTTPSTDAAVSAPQLVVLTPLNSLMAGVIVLYFSVDRKT